MRLVCPECHSNVTIPDDAAGKEATCPTCGKSFPTPSRYTAAVSELGAAVAAGTAGGAAPPGLVPPPPPVSADAPAAPPGLVPPTSTGGFLPAPGAEVPALAGYAHTFGITISPKVVVWLPAALLTLVLLLTFFPWVGSYAGESAVYSQRPWGAMFGSKPSRNFKLEQAGMIPGGWLEKMKSDWPLVLFFLALFLALAFAWADRGLGATDPRKVPPLAKLWPWRNSIVAGASALALVFLLWQLSAGFSMERAIKQHIADKAAERRTAAAANNPSAPAPDPETMKYEDEQAYRIYDVERTWWLYLALLCNALAVGAIMIRAGLDNRGNNKPPPKLLLHY